MMDDGAGRGRGGAQAGGAQRAARQQTIARLY